jgi:hypothetical protein
MQQVLLPKKHPVLLAKKAASKRVTGNDRQKPLKNKNLHFTEREIEALTWIGEQYAVRLDHLQVLLGRGTESETAVQGRLATKSVRNLLYRKWKPLGLVKTNKILHKSPLWIWAARKGLYHIGLPYRERIPSQFLLNHYHTVNAVRLKLEQNGITHWKSERQLKYEMFRERMDQGEIAIPKPGVCIPDAVVTYKGMEIAVEVEIVRKNGKTLDEIIKTLDKNYQHVWYFVSRSARPAVEKSVKGLDKFLLYDLMDVIGDEHS